MKSEMYVKNENRNNIYCHLATCYYVIGKFVFYLFFWSLFVAASSAIFGFKVFLFFVFREKMVCKNCFLYDQEELEVQCCFF